MLFVFMITALTVLFNNPKGVYQRQYEALRAHVIDGLSVKEAAERFGFAHKPSIPCADRPVKKARLTRSAPPNPVPNPARATHWTSAGPNAYWRCAKSTA